MADRWNGTPLMAALRNGHLAIAKMLMSCEATLGDNADPALVQVSNTLLAFSVVMVLSIMLNSANLKKWCIDVHTRVETQVMTGNLLQLKL